MSDKIRCTLAGNALDHLILAGQLARKDKPRHLKHAVANLADGVELLLKARLEIEDWRLLFPHFGKDRTNEQEMCQHCGKAPHATAPSAPDPDRKRYRNGDFESVKYHEAVKRLKKVCEVRITRGQKKVLDTVRSLRNKVRHHSLRVSRSAVLSVITRTYSFALDFIRDEIDGKTKTDTGRYVEKLRELLGTYEAFVKDRMEQAKPALGEAYGLTLDCPTCLQPALHAGGDGSRCEFCGKNGTGEEIASEWAERNLGRRRLKELAVEPYTEACPECEQDACVRISTRSTDYHCFACGEGGSYDHCCDCQQLFDNTPTAADLDDYDYCPQGRCEECFRDLCERND